VPTSVIARAPVRIDFGGGWTDVPPYPVEQGGYVCNIAIARYATATVTAPATLSSSATLTAAATREETSGRPLVTAALARFGVTGATVDLASDYPEGAGLGGSSAAGVALCGALSLWRGESLSPGELAERSRTLEAEDLGIAGGRQDHYAAAVGGALGLTFGSQVKVQRIPLSPQLQAELERRCLVYYTGESRISAETITAVLDAYRAREPRVVRSLHRMKELALNMTKALASGAVDDLGALVREHWEHQRSLHPGIPTPLIDEIIQRAYANGAIGAKALGASGGGCVLCIAADGESDALRRALAPLAQPVIFTIDRRGFHATALG